MHRVGVILSRVLLLVRWVMMMVVVMVMILVLLMVMMGSRWIDGRVILHEVQIEGVG